MNEATVYLVDDEAETLQLLSDAVALVGMTAKTYTQATLFIEQNRCFGSNDILVLDLQMPGIDGIEVMRRLAKSHNSPVIILISGTDSSLLRAAEKLGLAYDLKIYGILSKPIEIDDFLRLLKKYHQSYIKRPSSLSSLNGAAFTATELNYAIDNDQLILHYQPQLDMVSGKLRGVECLVRWNHPEWGLIYPDQFILLAEQSGVIGKLTRCVIDKAVHQNQQLQSLGIPITTSINISADDITQLTQPEQITALLANNRLDPTTLILEVTESSLMRELATSLDILTRLRLKGIGLSIDDFGTGYSSLSQLHRIPFTELKVDRSFVGNMIKDPEAFAIVKTCILLGHELNMQVVAEGVENQETWDLLVSLGCNIAQGYFIAKPMSELALVEWIKHY